MADTVLSALTTYRVNLKEFYTKYGSYDWGSIIGFVDQTPYRHSAAIHQTLMENIDESYCANLVMSLDWTKRFTSQTILSTINVEFASGKFIF